jgi:hypothetical protein
MADIPGLPQGFDITGGLRLGAGLAGQRRQTQLAQAQFDEELRARQVQEAAQLEAQEQAASMNRFNKGVSIVDLLVKGGATDDVVNKAINTHVLPELDEISENIDFSSNASEAAKALTVIRDAQVKNIKSGMSRSDALDISAEALISLSEQFPKVKAIETAVARIGEQQKMQALASLEKDPTRKEALLRGVTPSEIKSLQPTQKTTIKSVSIGKGMEQLQLLDDKGNKLRDIGKPRRIFKPTKGKPFKQSQVLFFKLGVDGLPEEVEALTATDGNISIDKMNDLLNKGFVPKGFTRAGKQPLVIDFSGLDRANRADTVTAQPPVERATPGETQAAVQESERNLILNDPVFLKFASDTKELNKAKGSRQPTQEELIKEFKRKTGVK